MKIVAFIPARLESKRLPNKVLKLIYGIPMIEHVRRRALISGVFDEVYVVTNSKIIKNKLKKYGAKFIFTKKKHFNGTSRVSEISLKYSFDFAFILFGDEPFINPNIMPKCIKEINKNKKIKAYNVVTDLKLGDLESSEVVKSVEDKNKLIIDYYRLSKKYKISRRLKKSSGILIFKKMLIDNYKKLKIKKRERNNKIEQFRLLENKISIKSIYIKDINPSVNTEKELKNLLDSVKNNKKEQKILTKIKKIEY